MRGLYETAEKHGGFINAHTAAAYSLTTLAFCHSIWDGEVAQFDLLKGEIEEMPEGTLISASEELQFPPFAHKFVMIKEN